MRQAFQTATDANQRRETLRRLMADFQGKVGEVMTPAQRPVFEQVRQRFVDAQRPGQPGTAGRVFVPGADGKADVARLRLGITDGQFTEVIDGARGRRGGDHRDRAAPAGTRRLLRLRDIGSRWRWSKSGN